MSDENQKTTTEKQACSGSAEAPLLYGVIYADPPWKYSFSKSNSRKIENQYQTMTVKEICSLDVPAAKIAFCICGQQPPNFLRLWQ